MIRSLLAIALLATIAGCGSRTPLKPQPGMGVVPTATAASQPETPRELMTPSTQARPERNADLLTRSQERTQDRFDLPPDETNGR
jgi:predicted small lipoprotein YifL